MANNSTASDEGSGGRFINPCVAAFPTISGAFFILIFIISVLGNGLLLCVLVMYDNLKSVTNIFILNLACSDLLFSITLPFWAVDHLHDWVFGEFVCKFLTAVYFVGLYSSVILLTGMTVDRFVTLVLHNCLSNLVRKRCAIAGCIAAWVISISASLSDAINVKVEHWDDRSYCEDTSDDKLGYYLQVSLLFFLPFAIIIFCYSAILKTVLQGLNRKKHRTVAVLLCIVAAFFICWGPYHILLLIKSLYKPENCKEDEKLDIASHICEILAYSHCCMNPLLYMLSQKLRKHLLNIFRCENVFRKNTENCQNTIVTKSVAFTAQSSAVNFNCTTS